MVVHECGETKLERNGLPRGNLTVVICGGFGAELRGINSLAIAGDEVIVEGVFHVRSAGWNAE